MLRKLCLVSLLALAWLVAGDRAAPPLRAADKPAAKDAPYVHVVLFTMKKDAPAADVDLAIKDAHEMLEKIPTVRSLKIGRPAEKATPMFAKKDYQIGLVVLFDDYDGLQTYLDHAQHTQFVEKHSKNWDMEALRVFDFMDQKK
jgi:hypothetical protein